MREFLAVGAAILFVLSGIAGPAAAAPTAGQSPGGTVQPATASVQPATATGQSADSDAAAAPPASLQRSGSIGDCAAAPPEDHDDPEDDVLGWSEGYWYNESIAVNDSGGLNESELDALVSRTQARVEAIRCLEFESDTEVEIRTRAEFRNSSTFENVTASQRQFQNVTYEALMLVGADEDAVAVQQENLGAGVGGYYEPTTDRLVVVSDDPDAVQFSEPVLAHELVHAVQDQRFNLTRYDARTIDDANAENGLIEGDAGYVETLYRDACEGNWSGTCRTDDDDDRAAAGDIPNLPLYLLSYQPYSDGPAFVDQLRGGGNWSAVDRAYERVPNTSQEVMYPDRYPNETTRNLSAPNGSSDVWERLAVEGRPNYEIAGEPALFTMFAAPTFTGDRNPPFVPAGFYQDDSESLDPYDYSADVTDGWDGDRLAPYRNADNETGYVWQIAWESGADAETFASEYGDLLRYYDADPVDGRADTYSIGGEFEGAYSVQLNGSVVRIVHAPTVEELRELHPDAAPEGESTVTEADDRNAIPGFGVAAAAAALVGAALLAARRALEN